MKLRTLASIVLIAALPMAAQVAHPASCNGGNNASGATQTSWSCTLTVPSGGFITVLLACGGCGTVPTSYSASDTLGSTFTFAGANANFAAADGYWLALEAATANGSGSDTVTFTASPAKGFTAVLVDAWTGAIPTLDGAVTVDTCGSCGVTYSTTAANELVYFGSMVGGTVTAASGWTLAQNSQTDGVQWISPGVVTNQTAAWGTATGTWIALVAVFKAAASPHAVMKGMVLKGGVVR